MSSDDDLEIPDFDQDLSDSESEFMQKKNDGPAKKSSTTAKNIPEKSNKNDSTTTAKASTSSSIKPASKPTSNGKKVCKFCDQDLTRWKLSTEKFREHMDKCETKKHLHQYILKNNNAGVFQCQLCPKANVRYDTMLKHVEEKHKESIKGSVEGTPLVESVPRMCSFCDDEFGKIHTQECRNFKQFFVKEIFENNISCMFCSKSYKKLDGLYDHLENKHGKEIKQVLKKKEILCKHCQGPKYSKFSKSCKKCLDDILKKNFESFEGYKFKCLKCNKQLDNKTYTYDHFETCSKTTEIENLFSGDEHEDISNSKSAKNKQKNNFSTNIELKKKKSENSLPDTSTMSDVSDNTVWFENTNLDYELDDTTSTNHTNDVLSVPTTTDSDLLSICIKKNLERSFSRKCKHCEKHLEKSCLNPKLNVDKLSQKCIEEERIKIRENATILQINNAVSETSAATDLDDDFSDSDNSSSKSFKKLVSHLNVERNRTTEKAKESVFTSFLRQMLLRLQEKDIEKHFDVPVTEKYDIPNYSRVISKPMDFRTMKSKLHNYKDMVSFQADFELMCKNAMSYNKNYTIYHKKAKEMLEFGQKLFVQQQSKTQMESIGDKVVDFKESKLEDSDIEILWTNPHITPKAINLRSELLSPLVKVKVENILHDTTTSSINTKTQQNYSENIFDKSKWEKLKSDVMRMFSNLKKSSSTGTLTSTYIKRMKFGLNQKLKEFNELNLEGQDDKMKRKKDGCINTIKNYISTLEDKEQRLRKEKMPLVKRQNEETHSSTTTKRRRIEEEENSENGYNISENFSDICSNISENESISNFFNNQDSSNKTGENSNRIESRDNNEDNSNNDNAKAEEENSENDYNMSENFSDICSNISENEFINFPNNQDSTNKNGENSNGIGSSSSNFEDDNTNTDTPETKVGKRRIKIVPMANVVKEEPIIDVKPKRTLINYFVCPICDETEGAIFRSEEISKVRKHLVIEHKYSEEKQVKTGLSIPNVPMLDII